MPRGDLRTALPFDRRTRVFVMRVMGRYRETTQTRSRPAVLRGPSAARLRSFPSIDEQTASCYFFRPSRPM